MFFLDRGCILTTAEHDPLWLERVRQSAPAGANWQTHLIPPRVGDEPPRCRSAFPGFQGMCFESYVTSIDAHPDHCFDVVLIDGRARADALRLAPRKVADDGFIVLDNAERPRYREAIAALQESGWEMTRFSGSGPNVPQEFWDTCLFRRARGMRSTAAIRDNAS